MELHASDIVLVTGGGSGIGMGLAAAFHGRGATVVIAGRNLRKLEAVASHYPGMLAEQVDVANADSVSALRDRVAAKFGSLSLLVNNAGIQRRLDFAASPIPSEAIWKEEIEINFTGLVRVTSSFLPLLQTRQPGAIVHVGSGLGYVPLIAAPVYSATKAAVHSFTISLRQQLKPTGVRVVEIIPPVVETDLHAGQPAKPPRAMPLATFVQQAMAGLDSGKDEVPVGIVKLLRVGSRVAPGLFLRVINRQR